MASTSQWLDTAAAAVVLGISARQLRKLRKEGLFKLGKHYRIPSAPGAARPTYQWHPERCAQALETPMEKRS
ncbi:helix-turn-helix domain-containing protein [Coleofasciculus sp. FACHB-SPT9]|uniref:helix-turn-helix domain-containing protein n=1 Tax=Cyanophyceae TaxID=3028117 RepID=UPI001684B3E2|nr:helix-turn-helix domain-containing protein [Coleofasciculus sp. FACHB-SPT9]MBD1887942.1 helix-turn-helix domain-containing protein [Coleofasciculus sp. FACHB-SPT9]